MFDLRKIEAFCKVCEQRSFSKAGESLFLSQPTVSAHIQALERDFETRLLDRMGRTVLPTPAGAVLYRYAKQAFDRLEAAKAEIRALSMEVAGDLLLGSSSIPAHHMLPGVLTEFVEAYPGVRPSLMVASSASVTRQILEGELMAGIVGIPSQADPDLFSTPVLESDIIIITPACTTPLPHTDPPAPGAGCAPSLPEIDFATASSLHWILREASSTTRRSFEEALRAAGHDARLLRPRLVVDSSHAAVQYVRAGLGVSAAARIAVEDALNRGEVRAYSLAGVRASRRFFCIMNARRMPFPAATVFLEFLLAKTRRPRSTATMPQQT
jgi:DNA-binding transcriptional LysR family regulator